MGDVTALIERARGGDKLALDRIFELLYPELRRIAHRRLAPHQRDGAVDTTALVHECYLKLAERHALRPADRVHFLAYAATAMRSIVIDIARGQAAQRRGGGERPVTLDTHALESVAGPADDLLDVDAALGDLERIDPRLARVVEMRYFGGMTDDEIAEALGITDRTVRRDWVKARLLLAHAMRS